MPALNDLLGATGHEHHPQPLERDVASRSASATWTAIALALSLAPGTIGLRAMSASATRGDRRDERSRGQQSAAATSLAGTEHGRERDCAGAAEHRPPDRQRRVDPLEQTR